MATELSRLNAEVSVTRFWGGDARGVCLQLTGRNGFVQLSREDAVQLASTLLRFYLNPMDNKLEE